MWRAAKMPRRLSCSRQYTALLSMLGTAAAMLALACICLGSAPALAQPTNNDYYKGAGTELLRNVEKYHLGPATDKLRSRAYESGVGDIGFMLTYFPNHPRALMLMIELCEQWTLASAAAGSPIGSARIVRDLAKEHGGKPDATIWFDGAQAAGARGGARQCDRSAMRPHPMTATCATPLTRAPRSLPRAGDRRAHGASGQDICWAAMIVGYEAAGRIGDARRGGTGGAPRVPDCRLRRRRRGGEAPQADRRADGARDRHRGDHDGRPLDGTNSWAREYMGANAAVVRGGRRAWPRAAASRSTRTCSKRRAVSGRLRRCGASEKAAPSA